MLSQQCRKGQRTPCHLLSPRGPTKSNLCRQKCRVNRRVNAGKLCGYSMIDVRYRYSEGMIAVIGRKSCATHETTQNIHNNGHRPLPSVFSSRSFASLILLAIYGEPPRSGWFASMICLCASLSRVLNSGPSLNPRIQSTSNQDICVPKLVIEIDQP